MQTSTRAPFGRILATLAALGATGLACAAPPLYRITDLGLPDGSDEVHAEALNDRDEVLGTVTSATWVQRPDSPFTWSSAGGMRVGAPPKESVFRTLNAMDDKGHVVGTQSCHACVDQGFYRSAHAPVRMLDGLYDGAPAKAAGVNEHGLIVGSSYYVDSLWHAVTWSPQGGAVDRTPGAHSSEGVAINNRGQLTGWMQKNAHASTTAMVVHPDGHVTELGSLPGDGNSYARAINSGGAVVGTSARPGAWGSHAFLWTPGAGMRDLVAGSAYSDWEADAMDLNDAGEAIGVIYNTADQFRLFHWDAVDGVQPLDDLIAPDDPLAGKVKFQDFAGINNGGRIALSGLLDGVWHAFLLTPVTTR